MFIFRLSISAE